MLVNRNKLLKTEQLETSGTIQKGPFVPKEIITEQIVPFHLNEKGHCVPSYHKRNLLFRIQASLFLLLISCRNKVPLYVF